MERPSPLWIPERINEEILEVNANGLPKRISLEILKRILENSLKEYKERFLRKTGKINESVSEKCQRKPFKES